ncbi:MAG: SUMF1/EgtB/PvdO family nonheme iron enzyme, partial [Treponema sp.]|nr:SUMF1/EgtB/PvdO family nonheme iron enzyme [Treponema sp.]
DKSDIIIYNAIRYLNTISSLLGYEPYYTILYPDEEGTYSAVDDDYLIAHNLDFRISYDNYDKDLNKLFNKIKIIGNPLADGFRYVTQTEETDEEDDLQYLSDITYSLGDLKSKAIVSCGLPPEIDSTELKENEMGIVTTDLTYEYYYDHFYICKNIPQAPEQLAELENLIAQYAEKVRVKKLAAFESVLGKSLNTLMKPVKGGKALQSLDIENKNFVDVTIGSFEMSEVPFTEKLYYALMEEPYPDNDSSPHPDSYRELSWYQAAAICNMLSDLYQYQRVYTFYRETVAIDYTANGFRMPTEAEWEHAARSGTTDKSIKYGVTIDSVIYYGNPSLYSYVEDDWENYYRWRGDDPVNAYTGKANSLGIYNLAGYCTEWCNDYQYFDYYDFEGDTTTYSVSCYDTYPYQSTKMPYGQIYTPERIVKGAYRYTSEASDVKLSKRETRKIYNTDHALRLVRTTNPQEMKKLLQEHESEHLENLKSQKPFFDQNLNMVAVKAQDYIYRNSYGEKRENKIIHVEDFEIADAEITNEMFIRLMHYNPWAQDTDEKDYNDAPNAPVTNFDPLAAYYFCNELSKVYGYTPFYNIDEQTVNADADGFRLPTTEEWIFAAMEANPDYNLLYSGGSDRDAVGVFERSKPQEIKTKQPNKLGLYDMSGNAEEFVHDNAGWRDYYNWYSAMGSSYDYDHESLYYEGSWHRDNTETVGLRVVRTPHAVQ